MPTELAIHCVKVRWIYVEWVPRIMFNYFCLLFWKKKKTHVDEFWSLGFMEKLSNMNSVFLLFLQRCLSYFVSIKTVSVIFEWEWIRGKTDILKSSE